MNLIEKIDKRFYPYYQKNWDDILFRSYVLKNIDPTVNMLDLGAGAGRVEHMNFRGIAGRVCGVDLDPRVLKNRFLDEPKVANIYHLPYSRDSFDIVIANNVLEHFENPRAAFNEVNRVLKKSGLFPFKTPNRLHYVSAFASFTPIVFHRWVNKVRGRAGQDTFPTKYRANTVRTIKELAKLTGFSVNEIKLIEGRPEYCRISLLTYMAGMVYERFVNYSETLSKFRVLIIGSLCKK